MDEHIEKLKQMVLQGGANWVGRQESLIEDAADAYILFEAPHSKKLLSLADNEFFTVNAIQERVWDADRKFHLMDGDENDIE